MARPQSDRVVVRFVRDHRVKPWAVLWRSYDADTKLRRRFKTHLATEAEARAFAADKEIELRHVTELLKRFARAPQPTVGGAVTLNAHTLHWLDTIASRKKGGSWLNYESMMRLHVLPYFGDVELTADTFTTQTVISIAARAQENGLDWSAQRQVCACSARVYGGRVRRSASCCRRIRSTV